jgi:hypothetical protein
MRMPEWPRLEIINDLDSSGDKSGQHEGMAIPVCLPSADLTCGGHIWSKDEKERVTLARG